MKADFEKVKRAYEKLKEIEKDCGYREFEVAYLILERLDNVIDSKTLIKFLNLFENLLAASSVVNFVILYNFSISSNEGK